MLCVGCMRSILQAEPTFWDYAVAESCWQPHFQQQSSGRESISSSAGENSDTIMNHLGQLKMCVDLVWPLITVIDHQKHWTPDECLNNHAWYYVSHSWVWRSCHQNRWESLHLDVWKPSMTLKIKSYPAGDVQFKLAILRPCSHEWQWSKQTIGTRPFQTRKMRRKQVIRKHAWLSTWTKSKCWRQRLPREERRMGIHWFSLVLAGVTWWYHVCIGTTPLAWRDAKGMVRHGMVFHSVNSETKPCRTMPWARFRLDSPLGTLASNECSAELTSEFHR